MKTESQSIYAQLFFTETIWKNTFQEQGKWLQKDNLSSKKKWRT